MVVIFVPPPFIPGLYFMTCNHPNPSRLQATPPLEQVMAVDILTANTVNFREGTFHPTENIAEKHAHY
jgi:hypothetical protein